MGVGTGSAALAFGGHPPTVGTTEEFTSSTNTITAAAWSSGVHYQLLDDTLEVLELQQQVLLLLGIRLPHLMQQRSMMEVLILAEEI